MANLNFKTRGMSNPQGKPKVYFCCHPADFKAFFDEISDEILQYQNCAIWYDADSMAEEDDRAYLADLSQMQLFVMPVTTRLLCTKNRALDIAFPYAIENHIPVLPLIQESGLEELFNQKCGNLQFLDKYNQDTTAISYTEKLEQYLSSVLIGDELAAKVRAAFDAYVFLSYRKKDRKHAQELMQLIHKNDFCRDIAIWYDEFLTPGENFNDAIKAALEKSDLFAMVVTPNLVNEKNYVMTTEYPMAKAANKHILPAKMVETDSDALAESFAGLENVTDAHDEAALTAVLLQAVQKMAIKENDNLPEHNFFIGLAYLGGIDVEVDYARALQLITDSANAGLIEAIEQLVQMYRTGKGVARNYEIAIQWQEKKLAFLKNRFAQERSEKNGDLLFWALCHCGGYYKELGKILFAQHKFEEALDLAEKLECDYRSNDMRRNLFVSYDKLGTICKAEGNLIKAKEYYEKGLFIVEELVKVERTIESQRGLSQSHDSLGNICKAEGDLTKAKEHYEKGLFIRKGLVGKTEMVESKVNVSISYNNLGNICEMEGDLTKAKEYYEKGVFIREELVQEIGTIQLKQYLFVSYDRLGNICKTEGNLIKAKEYYEKGLTLAKELADKTETVDAKRNLFISYSNLGNIYYKVEGNVSKAKKYYEKSILVAKELEMKTESITAKQDLSVNYARLGNLYKAEGDLEKAREYYEKAIILTEDIVNKTEILEFKQGLFIDNEKLGDIYKAEGNLRKAREYYEKGLALAEELLKKAETTESFKHVSISLHKLGNICSAEGNLAKAREYYEQSLAITEELVKKTGMAESQRDLSLCYNKLGDIYKTEGNFEKARDYYEKGLLISEELVKKTGTVESKRDLSVNYKFLGASYEAEGNLEKARDYYKKELAITKELALLTKSKRSYDNLAFSFYTMAMMSENEISKKSYLLSAFEIYAGLSCLCPNIKRYSENRDIMKQLLEEIGPLE